MKRTVHFISCIAVCLLVYISAAAQEKEFTGDLGPGGQGIIPDGSGFVGADFTCTVSGIGELKKNFFVRVLVDITHTYDSDLRAILTSPKGTTLLLFDGVGGGNDNFKQTRFTQTALYKIDDKEYASAPFNGEFLPQADEGLAAFDGENADGTWKLTIYDDVLADQGNLNEWKLVFNPSAGNEVPKANFDYAQPNEYKRKIIFTNTSLHFPETFFWDFGDGKTSTEQHPEHTYYADGTYNVKLVVSNNGGTDSMIKQVEVIKLVDDDEETGIATHSRANIGVYPNPAKDFIFVADAEGAALTIFNSVGQMVAEQKLLANEEKINLFYLPSGIYSLRIRETEKTHFRNLILTQ